MNKFSRMVWPLLIVLGLFFVLLWDQGSGLSSPGLWLIPAGVVGGLVTVLRNQGLSKASNKWLVGIWCLAFLSIGGVYLDIGWNKESFGGGGLIWILPALFFTLSGLILLVTRLVRR